MWIIDWMRHRLRRSGGPAPQSTTGPGPEPGHVGRIAGVDAGYAGETGAERRASGNAEQ
jgi:hypothetical protein